MSGVTLLGILFAPQLVEVMTWWSWSPEKTELTVLLTRVMWPFILLVSVAALVMGILNAKHVFGAPAMASGCLKLGSIIAGGLADLVGFRGMYVGSLVIIAGGMALLLASWKSLPRPGVHA